MYQHRHKTTSQSKNPVPDSNISYQTHKNSYQQKHLSSISICSQQSQKYQYQSTVPSYQCYCHTHNTHIHLTQKIIINTTCSFQENTKNTLKKGLPNNQHTRIKKGEPQSILSVHTGETNIHILNSKTSKT
jgi:hypothetical protein